MLAINFEVIYQPVGIELLLPFSVLLIATILGRLGSRSVR